MPDVRVFRNDGDELFVDNPGTIEYIDPGVVLLYADTESDVVCTYLEGRLGQPVQATAECTFTDGIDLSGVRPAIEAVDASGFSVSTASREDVSSARWALDGLTEDPLRLADPELDAIRCLVESDEHTGTGRDWLPGLPFGTGQRRSFGDVDSDKLLADADADSDGGSESDGRPGDPERHPDARSIGDGDAAAADREGRADGAAAAPAGTTLDFAVRSTYDAARFFAFLVDALADTELTVAVSKAGRVDAIADVDIVIHPDGDLPPGSRVEPLPKTSERIDVAKEQVALASARNLLADSVADLGDAYREAAADPAVDDHIVETVLRDLLDAGLGRHSSLAVVDRWRARYRRARVAVIATVLGVVAGVLGSESIRFAARRAETAARGLTTTDPTVFRAALVDAVGGAGVLAALPVPVGSALVLVAALAIRRRHSADGVDRDRRPSTARSDFFRLALTAVSVGALLALLASTALLWTTG